MGLPLYLALSRREWEQSVPLPEHSGWMACRFSSFGSRLCNLPPADFPGSLLILDDEIPPAGIQPEQIRRQLLQILEAGSYQALLLDFQRPDNPEALALAASLTHDFPCPVGVSAPYARDLPCPVFLPPLPLRQTAAAYLGPWHGREIWLEAALDQETVTVDKTGATVSESISSQEDRPDFSDEALHCRYQLEILEDRAIFSLYRTPAELEALLCDAQSLGVRQAVGLYQELGDVRT